MVVFPEANTHTNNMTYVLNMWEKVSNKEGSNINTYCRQL